MRQPGDKQARDRAMRELGTTFLVEAGAGTGKTFILVERFVNSLRSGLPLSSIVAITFTEKAAGDLRQRLTTRLEELLTGRPEDLRGSEPLSQSETELLQQALDDIDTAAVSTIHSFAGRLLRERPVEAATDPAFSQLDELGSEILLARLWREWLEAGAEDEAGAGRQALAAALAAGVGLSTVETIARAHFKHRHSLGAQTGAPEFDGVEVVSRLRLFVPALRSSGSSCTDPEDRLCAGMLWLADDLEALDPGADRSDLGWSLVALRQRRTRYGGKNAGSQANWPGGKDAPLRVRDDALDEVGRAARAFAEYLAGLVADAARGFSAFAAVRQSQAGVLDFDDLLGQARDLLAGRTCTAAEARRVRETLMDRYRCVLVDEFQDTDPLQVEIVFLLCAADPADNDWQTVRLVPGKLFLVGDPKQSIYRFRNADIAIFQRVKGLVKRQGEVLSISQNFRTLPGVVEWVNGAFREIIGAVDEELRPAYSPIHAWREDPQPDRLKVTVVRPAVPLAEPKADELRAAEAALLAATLGRIDSLGWVVGSDAPRPATLGDVTILLRTFTGIDHYERALRDAGVPYRVEGGRSFFQRPEIVDTLAGLRAIDVPGDDLAVYAALHGMLFGFSDEELYHFHAAGGRFDPFAAAPAGFEGVGEALATLRDLHAARTAHSISHVVEKLVRTTGVRALLAADGGGAQASGNLDKLVELAEAFSAEDEATFHAYVRKLGELQARAEEGESPVGEAGEFVRLMSIHKAKGLEFAIVMLADTGALPRSIAYNDVVVDRDKGRLLFGMSVDAPEGTAKPERCQLAGDTAVRQREADARTYEGLRLLYVAATRAKERLVVPVVSDDAPARGSFLEQLGPYLLQDDGPAPCVEVLEAVPACGEGRSVGEPPPHDLLQRRAAWAAGRSEALRAASAPALVTSPSRLELLDPPEAGTWDSFASNEDALVLGQLVHRIMESATLTDATTLASSAQAAVDEAARPDLRQKALALATACWRSAPVRAAAAGRHWKEVPVSASFDGLVLEGYVDLLYEAGGELVVIDFKTDRDGDVTAAGRRYALQLGAYALALEAGTGRNVSAAWVVMAAGDGPDGTAPAARIAVDDALRERVRAAARDAALAGEPIIEGDPA